VVTDVDQFAPELAETITSSKKEGVELAVSNPCFEAWLVFHQSASTAPMTTGDIQSRAKALGIVDSANPKRIVERMLTGKYRDASETAIRLRAHHASTGNSFPDDTPSSNVDELVSKIIGYARASGFHGTEPY